MGEIAYFGILILPKILNAYINIETQIPVPMSRMAEV